MHRFISWQSTQDFREDQSILAPSSCKALRPRSYGPPSCRRGSVHHLHIADQMQQPGSLLTRASPRLINLRTSLKLQNSPCPLEEYVSHHLPRPTSRFFYLLFSSWVSFISLKDRCSSPPPLWLPFFPFAIHLLRAVTLWHLLYICS